MTVSGTKPSSIDLSKFDFDKVRPSPWFVFEAADGDGLEVCSDALGKERICLIKSSGNLEEWWTATAHANLIAISPDLLSRVRTLEEALAKYAQDKTCRGDLARITLGLPTVPAGGHLPVAISGSDEIVKSAYQIGWLRQTIKLAADRLDRLGDFKDMSTLKTIIRETASNLRRGSDEAESAAVTEVDRQTRARQAIGGQ